MTGLITPNQLLIRLVADIESSSKKLDFILQRKIEVAELAYNTRWHSTKGFVGLTPEQITLIKKLDSELLPEQISLYQGYAEVLPKIGRIIRILEHREKKIPEEMRINYAPVLGLLNLAGETFKKRWFGKNAISFLKSQALALKANDLNGFRELLRQEIKTSLPLLSYAAKTRETASLINSRLRRNMRIRDYAFVLFSMTFMVVSLGNLYLKVAALDKQYKAHGVTVVGSAENLPDNTPLLLFKMATGSVRTLEQEEAAYSVKDLERETATETLFQTSFSVDVLGNYSEYDLNVLKETIQRTYGSNVFRENGVKSLIFVDKPVFKKIHSRVTGVAGRASNDGKLFLIVPDEESRKTGDSMSHINRMKYVFFHELGHYRDYHFWKGDSDFPREWAAIEGGNVTEAASKDRFENIAEVNAAVMMSVEEDISINAPGCKTAEDELILKQRIELMLKYGFFPDAFKNKIEERANELGRTMFSPLSDEERASFNAEVAQLMRNK